jgi:hypothetical protein
MAESQHTTPCTTFIPVTTTSATFLTLLLFSTGDNNQKSMYGIRKTATPTYWLPPHSLHMNEKARLAHPVPYLALQAAGPGCGDVAGQRAALARRGSADR